MCEGMEDEVNCHDSVPFWLIVVPMCLILPIYVLGEVMFTKLSKACATKMTPSVQKEKVFVLNVANTIMSTANKKQKRQLLKLYRNYHEAC